MPIIQSRLDLDFYKLTMAQVILRHYWDVRVPWAFANRTNGIVLPKHIRLAELREELDYVRTLRPTGEELRYLREDPEIARILPGLFLTEFLAFFQNLQLPEVFTEVVPGSDGRDRLRIETEGTWREVTFWETYILSILTELYGRDLCERNGTSQWEIYREGDRRLETKIALLGDHPSVRFTEFGTRRRFSGPWQEHVLDRLLAEIPTQVVGTSNVMLAKYFGIAPVGTFAHEMFMVLYARAKALGSLTPVADAHDEVLRVWWGAYGEPLSIALTDTFGSEFFFSRFSREQALAWRGQRLDSGDPIEEGEKAIAFYERNNINPQDKLLLPSDGLTAETMVTITEHFAGRARIAHGWGTNATNDVGFAPLSLIVKAVAAEGHGTVKLSNNPAKAMGSAEDVEAVKREVGYADRAAQPVVY
ncbi:MAG: nicotinate phosphoribosyltransferase [Candidatus Terrybacteria bacterium]|nr:nicotinate phosphoribosyltransferase [Candidatus Terrybacteria bacterium]